MNKVRLKKAVKYIALLLVAVGLVYFVIYLFSYQELKPRKEEYLFDEELQGYYAGINTSQYDYSHSIELDINVDSGKVYIYLAEEDAIDFNENRQIYIKSGCEDKIVFFKEYDIDSQEIIDVKDITGRYSFGICADKDTNAQIKKVEKRFLQGHYVIGNQLYEMFGIDWFADELTKSVPNFGSAEELKDWIVDQHKNN